LPEIALPALLVLSYVCWPLQFDALGSTTFVFWCIFLAAFVALAVYDFRWFILPNKIVFPLIGLAVVQVVVVAVLAGSFQPILSAAIGCLVVGGLFYALFQLSGGSWIGGGDVKLGFALGLLAGGLLESLLLLFVASMVAMTFTLPQIIRGKAHRKSHVPFGPFLIIGLIVVMLVGAKIIDWYSNVLYI
jgi:leader peptidase (prepilin peptidase)/N-methyltransferase